MIEQYLETVKWADGREECEQFTVESRQQAEQDCQQFLRLAKEQGIDLDSYYLSDLGHNFFLTRNYHGAGFWDGNYPEPDATKLTDISNSFGGVSVWEDDSGLLELVDY